jgi:hypothetical protein
MAKSTYTHVVRTEKQLAALVSAARQEIIDVMAEMGTVSVAEIAATLGRPGVRPLLPSPSTQPGWFGTRGWLSLPAGTERGTFPIRFHPSSPSDTSIEASLIAAH